MNLLAFGLTKNQKIHLIELLRKKALTNVAIPLARDNLLGFCKQLKPQMQEINLKGK